MDYSKLSDFEINSAVSMALLDKSANPSARYVAIGDYCNNPTDAWPIIDENRISIMFDNTLPEHEGEYHEWCDAISPCQKFGVQHQLNPLRCAMIVFLMMQESANVQDNPSR